MATRRPVTQLRRYENGSSADDAEAIILSREVNNYFNGNTAERMRIINSHRNQQKKLKSPGGAIRTVYLLLVIHTLQNQLEAVQNQLAAVQNINQEVEEEEVVVATDNEEEAQPLAHQEAEEPVAE